MPATAPLGGVQGFDPARQISPSVVLPFVTPSTAHVTAWFDVDSTLAERLTGRFTATSAEIGLSITATALTTSIEADADWLESARLVATSVTGFEGGREAGAV